MPAAPILPYESLAPPRSRWDLAFEIVLAALLAFMPFALGAVEAWSELVVTAGAALLAVGLAVRTAIDRTFRPIWTWAYVPLALFVLFTVIQVAPLPTAMVEAMSPQTAAIRQELLGADAKPQAASTVSLYPLATAHGLRMLLAGCAVFATTACVFATPAQVKRLLFWVLAIGAAQAALALVQIFTLTDRIHWSLDTPGRVTSGSFINYSNFSQFMNLSIGAGLGLLLVRLHEGHRARGGDNSALSGARLQEHAGLAVALVMCAIAVFTSMSRNGAISLLVAAAVVGTALYLRGTLSRRGWLLAMIPLGTLAALLAFTFDIVYERLATLQREDAFEDRWQLTQDVLRAWQAFPIWGAGLGAHEFVFPMFDTADIPSVAGHADNDYAQLLEETGAVGAAAVGAFLAIIVALVVKLCRRGRTALSTAAFGLAFGLLAVAVHSASDFGQRLPAVFCLSAITCGLIVRMARWERDAARLSARAEAAISPIKPICAERPWRRQAAGATAAAAIAAVGAWAISGAWDAYRAETWRGAALALDQRISEDMLAGVSEEELDQDYVDLLAASEEAAEIEPGNVVYGYWLNAYRWQAVSRTIDSSTSATMLDAEVAPIVARIADELTSVRRLCPTYGPPYALEGQLRLAVLGEERGRELIGLGLRLAPYDPSACMNAAQIAAQEGRADKAAELLERAVELQPGNFRDAASILLLDLSRPDLAEKLADGDFARLSLLADLAASSSNTAPLAEGYREAAEEALRQRVAEGAADPAQLAALAAVEARRERHEEAIKLYRQALAANYKQVPWRMALARSLAALGRHDEAVHEAKICLRLRPNLAEAMKMVDDLSTRVN